MKTIQFKYFYFIQAVAFFFFINPHDIKAQHQNVNAGEILDNASFRVMYRFSQQAVKERESSEVTDTMTLDVGPKWSVYYDRNKLRRDSLSSVEFKKNPPKKIALYFDDDALRERLEAGNNVHEVLDKSKGESMWIFKQRDDGELVTFDDGPLEGFDTFTYFKLNEKISPQDWIITNDTLTVLGYLCQKATASFRGRDYIAWFTTDIPVNDGPWKLYGLPGIILKAKDIEGIFKFQAIGLQMLNEETINFPTDKKNVPCESMKKLKAFRKNRFKTVSIGFSDGAGGIAYYGTKNPIVYPDMEVDE